MTDSQSIPISSIRRDGGTQPRAAINREAVSDYMASMAPGAEFPPVIVFYDGADYWLADGFHRIQGAENAGRSDIACEVYQGTKQDAQWYSFGANKANGLRRTNRDKQRALRAALTHNNAGTLSDHQLAVHVGVDLKTVGNWRAKLTMEVPQSTKRKGLDGRTIDVTRIGKTSAPEQAPAPLEADAASPRPAPRTARAQRIEQLTRSILSFVEVTKHLAQPGRLGGRDRRRIRISVRPQRPERPRDGLQQFEHRRAEQADCRPHQLGQTHAKAARSRPPRGLKRICNGAKPMTQPLVSTYSMWSLFRNCRKAVELRYIQQLVPLDRDRNLHFGSIIHECLQAWHHRRDLEEVLTLIDRLCPERSQDETQRRDWHLATAMTKAYARHYASDDFEIVALEKNFAGPIVNPATGAASRSFVLAGKVDGIVRIGGDYFILEHKTAGQLDGDYLEKLWTDFQITIYAHYIEQTMGIPITGILYNVLVKAKLQQGKGETEEEYQARRAELLAKSKTGKTTAKRKLPESDEEFQQRLAEKYADPEMFHREMLYLSRDRFDVLRSELWELTQAFLDARRRGVFYQNTAFCFNYQRPCAYFPLCRSNGNPNVIENFYQRVPPNEELRVVPTESTEPAF